MKITSFVLLIALYSPFVMGQEKVTAPAPEAAAKPTVAVASPDKAVEDDITKNTGDPRGISDEKDVTELIIALQKKEAELQAAKEEIARLRAWIKKIKEASESENGTMHYNMGCMYKLYKQYGKAEAEFKQALKIMPDDPNIHYNLGILYDDDLGDKENAAKHYKRFLELSQNEQDRAQVQEWLSSLQ